MLNNEVIAMRKIHSSSVRSGKGKHIFAVFIAVLFFAAALMFIVADNDTENKDAAALSADSDAADTCELYDGSGTIVGTKYSFDDALSAASEEDGYTIKLLTDITRSSEIKVAGTSVTLDLNGHVLDAGSGLQVDNGELLLADPDDGEFNVYGMSSSDESDTVSAQGGSTVEVTNVYCSGNTGRFPAAVAAIESTVIVHGDAVNTADVMCPYGLYAEGGKITVRGDVTVISSSTAEGAYGVFAYFGEVSVHGDVTVTSPDDMLFIYCVQAINGEAAVYGNVTATCSGTAEAVFGLYADTGDIVVQGDVTVTGSIANSVLITAIWDSSVTIEGTASGPGVYIELEEYTLGPADHEAVSSKPGYFEYTDTYNHVWIKAPIEIISASVTVTAPVDGKHPDLIVTVDPDDEEKYTATVGWWDWYEDYYMSPGDTFAEGNAYIADVNLIPASGYSITDPIIVHINGEEAAYDPEYGYSVTFYASAPIEIISASVTVTVPVDGNHPDLTVTVDPNDEGKYTATVGWRDLEEDDHMSPGDTFVKGKIYFADVTITPKSGYSITDPIDVTINGEPAQNVWLFIYTREFIAEAVTVTAAPVGGVNAPVAGETPVAAVTATDQYTGTVTWSPAPADGKFGYGMIYVAYITLSAANGCTFGGYNDDVSIAGFTVNDIAPEWVGGDDGSLLFAVEFPATEAEISAIIITGVTAPVGGEAPATAGITVPPGAEYSIADNAIYHPAWDPAPASFEGGGSYTITIPVAAAPGYKFASGVTATVNGESVTYIGPGYQTDIGEILMIGYEFIASVPSVLTFNGSAAYDIPASAAGTAIMGIIVSGGVSGGTAPYAFAATGLPAGIVISETGIIYGTPAAAGAAGTATITVTDSVNDTASITIAYGTISAAADARTDDGGGGDGGGMSMAVIAVVAIAAIAVVGVVYLFVIKKP